MCAVVIECGCYVDFEKCICICKTTFFSSLFEHWVCLYCLYSKLIGRAKRANNSTNAQVFVYAHGQQRIVHTAHELSQQQQKQHHQSLGSRCLLCSILNVRLFPFMLRVECNATNETYTKNSKSCQTDVFMCRTFDGHSK